MDLEFFFGIYFLLCIFMLYAAPSVPRNVTATPINSTSVLISWDSPESPNGIIDSFLVTYVRLDPAGGVLSDSISTVGDTTTVVIGNLEPFTRYNVSVVGVTVAPGPPSDVEMVRTDESGKVTV